MKKLIVILMIFASIVLAQDSTKVSNQELQALQAQNQQLKTFLIEDYLQRKSQTLDDAFVELYIHCRDIEKKSLLLVRNQQIMERFMNDVVKVKTFAGLDSLLVKYQVKQ